MHPFISLVGHRDVASAGHPPLWTAVLAPLAKVGADGYEAARLTSALAGAAAVAVLGLVGRRVASPAAGLWAAALGAVYLPWIVGDTTGMSEALYLLLVGLTVLAVLAGRDSGRTALAVVAGACAGLAALTRTEGLLLVPLIAWPLLWGRGTAARWALPLVATLAALVVVAPWTIRNAAALDRFVLVSTNESTVLAGANCPETYYGRDTGSWRPECLARATRTTDLASYDEGVLAGRWSSAGREYARDHAGRLVTVVMPVRVLRTWRLWQPTREGRLSEGENADVAKIAAFVFLLLLLPGGVVGLVVARLPRDRVLVLVALAVMVSFTSAIGWGAPRFLRPAELALLVAAGAGVAAVLRRPAGAR